MADARGQTVSVRIGATRPTAATPSSRPPAPSSPSAAFCSPTRRAATSRSAGDDEERVLPPLSEGDALDGDRARAGGALDLAAGRATPRRARARRSRSAASAARRPTPRSSARSSTAGTCFKQGQALVPAFLAFAVVEPARAALRPAGGLRVHRAHGGRPRPDRLRRGGAQRWLGRFYFGERRAAGLKGRSRDLGEIDAREINTIEIGDGHRRSASVATGRTSSAAGSARAAARPRARRADGRARGGDPLAAAAVSASSASTPRRAARSSLRDRPLRPVRDGGRRGRDEKPRTASLFKTMSPETVTLDEALRLLTLPRVGRARPTARRWWPRTAVTAPTSRRTRSRARSRPRSSSSRSRSRRHSRCSRSPSSPRPPAAAPPLRELGADPVSGKPIVLKEGRFGPVRHRRRDEREPAAGR